MTPPSPAPGVLGAPPELPWGSATFFRKRWYDFSETIYKSMFLDGLGSCSAPQTKIVAFYCVFGDFSLFLKLFQVNFHRIGFFLYNIEFIFSRSSFFLHTCISLSDLKWAPEPVISCKRGCLFFYPTDLTFLDCPVGSRDVQILETRS